MRTCSFPYLDSTYLPKTMLVENFPVGNASLMSFGFKFFSPNYFITNTKLEEGVWHSLLFICFLTIVGNIISFMVYLAPLWVLFCLLPFPTQGDWSITMGRILIQLSFPPGRHFIRYTRRNPLKVFNQFLMWLHSSVQCCGSTTRW